MTQLRSRESSLFDSSVGIIRAQTDRTFGALLVLEWLFAITLAVTVTPFAWAGTTRTVHLHVYVAVGLGALINALPLTLVAIRPGWWLTRQTVTIAQILWSGLFIHLTGGRIETHFHIFVSLAFLAAYRDWRVFPTATFVVAIDHLLRGYWWPRSVYGAGTPETWRFLEHAAWVIFEDIVLVVGCLRAVAEMKLSCHREAALEGVNARIEQTVTERTAELTAANAALAEEMKTRLQMEAELRQAQKLESVGRLASGVAHEINTPVQFVSDSISFLRDATRDVMAVVEKLQAVRASVLSGEPSRAAAAAAVEAEDAADLPYVVEHMPKAFERSMDGLARVAAIVRSMKEFAHPDAKEMAAIDLNHAIESTLIIAKNEYKLVADVETSFGALPAVTCHAGEVNQVVLNIIVNAAHAIADVVKGSERRGKIFIRTRHEGAWAVIEIEDTGGGIPDAIRDRIFDPFFTTKEVGRGTGQGLAIARTVVVDTHEGQLEVRSDVGRGTTFEIRLPVAGGRAVPAVSGEDVAA